MSLRTTALHPLHQELNAKLVDFAGWELPVQYTGILAEHNHTRESASLFDVSHMGQVLLYPKSGNTDDAATALESIVPANLVGLPVGRQRYGLFTNADGGVLDDLMIARRDDYLFLVVNAARADHDLELLRTLSEVRVEPVVDRALLALQGPKAVDALARLIPEVTELKFMDSVELTFSPSPREEEGTTFSPYPREEEGTTFSPSPRGGGSGRGLPGITIWVSRSGYTGEDGFEISVPNTAAEEFARALLAQDEVLPAGLGARDSLRLEAGLPLYGHDLSPDITPVEAGIGWAIPKVRRTGGERAGGFPGAEHILAQLANGTDRIRVGLRAQGRAPVRDHAPIFINETDTTPVAEVTSGGFGASVGGPIAMAMLPTGTPIGSTVYAEVRGKKLPLTVTKLPFITSSYKR
ncbi:MAG: glycine cleavage system protein T [Propionibacterium sp.]|nr:MAG: glycine cleavage system protein T [Propionibacterium sp.]